MTKPELRKQLQAKRLALTAAVIQENSQTISRGLQTVVDWESIQAVHVYRPIDTLHEVNIAPWLEALLSSYPHIQVYSSQKIDGVWEITDMQGAVSSPAPKFYVVIVPILGFDALLNRIGYGGGYYDRLLAGQPQAVKIGVCYEMGKVEYIPHEPHDIPMDMIITEQRTYSA